MVLPNPLTLISKQNLPFFCSCSLVRTLTHNTHLGITHDNHNTRLGITHDNQKINIFFKSGLLSNAMQLFDEMPARDVVTWNLVIAGHARLGLTEQALHLFKKMASFRVSESATTLCSVLGVCGDAGHHTLGYALHARVIHLGFQSNVFVGSSLANLYMAVGYPELALKLFDKLLTRNTAMCNSILRGLLDLGMTDVMLELFLEMKSKEIDVNGVTLCYMLRGCCDDAMLEEGRQLHCHLIKLGLEAAIFVSNALVDFYSAVKSSTDAKRAIGSIAMEDVISWNSMIAAYADDGHLTEAFEYFHKMLEWGKNASVRSLVSFLKLCSGTQNLPLGLQIHCFGVKSGHVHGSVHVQSALIDMYGKCHKIWRSLMVFDEITEKVLECCNPLITSLVENNAPKDAIKMFSIAVAEGVLPDHVTFSAVLRAIGSSAFVSSLSCQALHCWVVKTGFENETVVASSLISAYSKCGHVDASLCIFESIPSPNMVCFTSVIAGFAGNGYGREGICMLNKMLRKGMKPDAVTLLSVLAGCDHSGLVEEGWSIFKAMKFAYGVDPDQRHYSCMVNLLGRAGLLEEAVQLAETSPSWNDYAMWGSLLHNCRVHGDEKVSRRVSDILMELKPHAGTRWLPSTGLSSKTTELESLESTEEGIGASVASKEIAYSLIEVHDR